MAADQREIGSEGAPINWEALAASDRFRRLLKAKRRFVIPAMIFFIVYYFALPVLVGYARPFMEKRVLGPVNLAYLFALSQFFMAWIIAALYVRAARDSTRWRLTSSSPTIARASNVFLLMLLILIQIQSTEPEEIMSRSRITSRS